MNCFELFAGCGGLGYGFHKESFNIVFDKIWIHGLVHLLGYRHKSNQDFSVMQKLENKIIKSLQ